MDIELVGDNAALNTLCQRLAASAWIALDTEFTRESTYYAKLGLLQVATADVIACVDPLACLSVTACSFAASRMTARHHAPALSRAT